MRIIYAVTVAGVMALDHPTAWQHYDRTFAGRNYFRVEEGSGPRVGAAARGLSNTPLV